MLNRLSSEQQAFVVQSLAKYDPVSVIREAIKRDFAIDVTVATIRRYDASRKAGARLAEPLRELFHQTRRAFLSDERPGILANQATRRELLNRLHATALSQGKRRLAGRIQAQIEAIGLSDTLPRMAVRQRPRAVRDRGTRAPPSARR